jgi:hypothetical protein
LGYLNRWKSVRPALALANDYGVESAVDGLMLHKAQGWTAVYHLRTTFVETPTPASKTSVLVYVIPSVVGGLIIVVVLLVLGITGRLSCKKKDPEWSAFGP